MYMVEPTLSPMVVLSYQPSRLDWFGPSTATFQVKDALLVLHWVQDNIEAFGGEVCSSFVLLVWQTCLWRDHTRHLLGTHPAYTDGYISECCYGIT